MSGADESASDETMHPLLAVILLLGAFVIIGTIVTTSTTSFLADADEAPHAYLRVDAESADALTVTRLNAQQGIVSGGYVSGEDNADVVIIRVNEDERASLTRANETVTVTGLASGDTITVIAERDESRAVLGQWSHGTFTADT